MINPIIVQYTILLLQQFGEFYTVANTADDNPAEIEFLYKQAKQDMRSKKCRGFILAAVAGVGSDWRQYMQSYRAQGEIVEALFDTPILACRSKDNVTPLHDSPAKFNRWAIICRKDSDRSEFEYEIKLRDGVYQSLHFDTPEEALAYAKGIRSPIYAPCRIERVINMPA